MAENTCMNLYKFSRSSTFRLIDQTTEETADVVPQGFNNSIRWNLGHILVSTDILLFGETANEKLKDLFNMGTKPADWQTDPPTLTELKDLLKEQHERIKATLVDRLHEELPNPFTIGNLQMKTFLDVFMFSIYHEGHHQGVIKGLQKTASN